MKTVSKAATVETAYGNPLPEPVKFSYVYEELTKGDTIPAKEYPDAEDLLTYVNQKRNAAARSQAQNAALTNAGIAKPTLEDPDVRLKSMIKILVAAGNSEDQAAQIARQALGM